MVNHLDNLRQSHNKLYCQSQKIIDLTNKILCDIIILSNSKGKTNKTETN